MSFTISAASGCSSSSTTRETHPSYYAFMKEGETTLGEYWESNPRSRCHDMMGHIIECYYNGIAGIESLEPGSRRVRVRPWLPDGMNRFDCAYKTPYGAVRVSAARDADGTPRYSTELPAGIEKEE